MDQLPRPGAGGLEATGATTRGKQSWVIVIVGEDPRGEWELLNVRRLRQCLAVGIGISGDYVTMIVDPVARARVEVAAATLDCLAREIRYS